MFRSAVATRTAFGLLPGGFLPTFDDRMTREYVLHPFRAPIAPQVDYARELNPQQLAAVTAPPGPGLVIAGAGSGKTRTLTYRVAYLLEQGVPPERMLLLTFTNKAAQEMMRRVADLLGRELPELWGGTFHAIGHRILRQHAPRLGWPRDFTILDREDANALIKACLQEAGPAVKGQRFPKAELLGEIFSLAVNLGKPLGQILAEQFDHFAGLERPITALADAYAGRKRAANALDFDDLLALWLQLLREHDEVRELYQRRFQFVLVDEYQDTNQLQADLIDLLVARHHNVMVVGDDAQSIYAWRGANFQNILRFPERHPGTTIYKIELNYRSTPEILAVANAAIAANRQQFHKHLTPARLSGMKPARVMCEDAGLQAAFVAERVLELHQEGRPLNRMAVLYRSHFHALELQLELTRRNIPFAIASGIRFFEQAHIKDATAYLRLVVNPHDELAFKRIAQLLPGVGAKVADRLWRAFLAAVPPARPEGTVPRSNDPAEDTPATNATDCPLAMALQSCRDVVPRKAEVGWAQLATTMAQLEAAHRRAGAAAMLQLVIEAGYAEHLQASYANYRARLEDLEQLTVFARQFASPEEFLNQLALLTNLEAEEVEPRPRDTDHLRLSTVHQAKGLEFDVVFVIMLCEGLFPSARSVVTASGEEEERRLFYVAITRARDQLYLIWPLLRAGYGSGGELLQRPSRFLREIPDALVEEWKLASHSSADPVAASADDRDF